MTTVYNQLTDDMPATSALRAGSAEPQAKYARIAAMAHPGQISTASLPADPLVANQWHLLATGQRGGTPGIDLNVVDVWKDYTGAGVTVGIWDDGVQYTHPDLDANYDPRLAMTVGGKLHDPAPQSPSSMHGTAVAGVIAAEANAVGTVGVAYGAHFAAVDIFFDPALNERASFLQLDRFDVTNHSWGFRAPYGTNLLDPTWDDFFAGWMRSVETGRHGLGTINVVAAGNDREEGRSTNDSNLTNIPQTIAVAAVSNNGSVSAYSTPGASVLVSAPSNGMAGAGIWTTDRTGTAGYSTGQSEAPVNANPNYTANFGGTSAATPEVTGVVALMLQANPDLGWRDVQQILAMTARHVGSEIGSAPSGFEGFAWDFNHARTWNGGGLHFSNDYGFGLVDGLAAVRLAETWTEQQTSANWRQTVAGTWSGDRVIPDDTPKGVSLAIKTTSDVALERVGLQLDIRYGLTGDLRVTLTSPSGTTSEVAIEHDFGGSSVDGWLFTSNAFRGESSTGTWRVNVSDRWAGGEGELVQAKLQFWGGAVDRDDTFVFTNEFSDYAGRFGHSRTIGDGNGGIDTINTASVTAATKIDLACGRGVIDGVVVRIAGGVENVISGDLADRLNGNNAANQLVGGRGNDLIRGAGGDDRLFGGPGRDDLGGGAGRDRLDGSLGADKLSGGKGDDRLSGGAGKDWLRDGSGRDWLTGGHGADLFDLRRDGRLDTIHDFQEGTDHIRLAGLRFKDLHFADLGHGQVELTYRGDVLHIDSSSDLLVAADLSQSDFLFA